MHLAALAKGIEMEMSQDLSQLVEDTREEIVELEEASNEEVLEFIKSQM